MYCNIVLVSAAYKVNRYTYTYIPLFWISFLFTTTEHQQSSLCYTNRLSLVIYCIHTIKQCVYVNPNPPIHPMLLQFDCKVVAPIPQNFKYFNKVRKIGNTESQYKKYFNYLIFSESSNITAIVKVRLSSSFASIQIECYFPSSEWINMLK